MDLVANKGKGPSLWCSIGNLSGKHRCRTFTCYIYIAQDSTITAARRGCEYTYYIIFTNCVVKWTILTKFSWHLVQHFFFPAYLFVSVHYLQTPKGWGIPTVATTWVSLTDLRKTNGIERAINWMFNPPVWASILFHAVKVEQKFPITPVFHGFYYLRWGSSVGTTTKFAFICDCDNFPATPTSFPRETRSGWVTIRQRKTYKIHKNKTPSAISRRSWLVIWKTKQNDRKSKSGSGASTPRNGGRPRTPNDLC